MPTYEVTTKQGTFEVSSERDLTPEEAMKMALSAKPVEDSEAFESRLAQAPDAPAMPFFDPSQKTPEQKVETFATDIKRLGEGALEMFTGEKRSTPEVDAAEDWNLMPEVAGINEPLKSLGVTLATISTDPNETAEIIKYNYPDVKFRQDKKGNFIFTSSVDGKDYAIKPGLGWSDFPRGVMKALEMLPAGKRATAFGKAIAGMGTEAAHQGVEAMAGGTFDKAPIAFEGAVPLAMGAGREVLGAAARPAEDITQRVMTETAEARTPTPDVVDVDTSIKGRDELTKRQATGFAGQAVKAMDGDEYDVMKAAKSIDADPEVLDSAERLGIQDYLQPDHYSTNLGYKQVRQLAKSKAGSSLKEDEAKKLEYIAKSLSDTVEEMGATRDMSELVGDIKSRIQSNLSKISEAEGKAFDEMRKGIPKDHRIKTPALEDYFAKRLDELDGDVTLLEPIEKQVYKSMGIGKVDDVVDASKPIDVSGMVAKKEANNQVYETGKPVDVFYFRNKESAPSIAGQYDQDIEPSGRYMNLESESMSNAPAPEGWERGRLSFKSPLVLEWNAKGGGYDADGWKSKLSEAYGGKTGDDLSKAIAKDGYDAIITVDKYGTNETVDLTMFDFHPKKEVSKTKVDLPQTKVVDDQGKPMKVFQGRSKTDLKSLVNPRGEGWFSSAKETAEVFAQDYGAGKGRVYEAYLDIKNPKTVDISETMWRREVEGEIAEKAKVQGHDGLIIEHGNGKKDYVVFNDSQIKRVDELDKSTGGQKYSKIDALRRKAGKIQNQLSLKGGPEAGQAKLLYGALAEDMGKAAEDLGMGKLRRKANLYTQVRKGWENDRDSLFGKELDKGLIEPLERGVKKLEKGEVANLNKIFKQIPRSMKKETMASAFRTAMGKKVNKGELSYAQFLGVLNGILDNKDAGRFVFTNLPEGSKKTFEDMEKVLSSIHSSLKQKPRGGATLQDYVKNLDETTSKLLTAGKGAAKTGLAEGLASVGGLSGVPTAVKILFSQKKADRDIVSDLAKFIVKPEFDAYIYKVATGEIDEATVKKLSKTPAFRNYAKKHLKENGEQWLMNIARPSTRLPETEEETK